MASQELGVALGAAAATIMIKNGQIFDVELSIKVGIHAEFSALY